MFDLTGTVRARSLSPIFEFMAGSGVLEIDNDVSSAFGRYRLTGLQQAVLKVARLPVLCRGWARPSWTRLLNWIRPGAMDLDDRGVRFRLYPKTNLIENGILLRKDYNLAEIEFLKQGLPGSNPVFVDIGANIGLYTLRIAKYLEGGDGKVIAIEPNPSTLERLNFNIDANKFDNVAVHAVAVGDYHGSATLNINKEDLAIVNTVQDDDGEITVVPLEEILKAEQVDHIDALKIDIEGYEYRALSPFFNRCARDLWPRRISIEHLGDKSDIEKLLREIGYRFLGKTRCNAFYELSD